MCFSFRGLWSFHESDAADTFRRSRNFATRDYTCQGSSLSEQNTPSGFSTSMITLTFARQRSIADIRMSVQGVSRVYVPNEIGANVCISVVADVPEFPSGAFDHRLLRYLMLRTKPVNRKTVPANSNSKKMSALLKKPRNAPPSDGSIPPKTRGML